MTDKEKLPPPRKSPRGSARCGAVARTHIRAVFGTVYNFSIIFAGYILGSGGVHTPSRRCAGVVWPTMGETPGRQRAFAAIIEASLTEQRFGIAGICDQCEASRRTVRRALKDAESSGWVEKPSQQAHRWVPGERARQHRVRGRWSLGDGGRDVESPRMFYVTSDAVAPRFLDGEDVMISAGAAWRADGAGFSLGVPDARCLYADSGGYQAAVYFRDGYPYSPAEYHEWADRIGAQWAFGMDWACEDAWTLAGAAGLSDTQRAAIPSVEERLERSWDDQVAQFEDHQSGRYGHRFAPVVQGQSVEQYREFAQRLEDSRLPTGGLVGVGTVCKRGSVDEIEAVLSVLEAELPEASFHLFGATLDVWGDERFEGRFVSSDTASWIGWADEESMYPSSAERKREAFERFSDRVGELR